MNENKNKKDLKQMLKKCSIMLEQALSLINNKIKTIEQIMLGNKINDEILEKITKEQEENAQNIENYLNTIWEFGTKHFSEEDQTFIYSTITKQPEEYGGLDDPYEYDGLPKLIRVLHITDLKIQYTLLMIDKVIKHFNSTTPPTRGGDSSTPPTMN